MSETAGAALAPKLSPLHPIAAGNEQRRWSWEGRNVAEDSVVPFQPALPRLSPGQGGAAPRRLGSGVLPPTAAAGVGLNEPKGAAGIA